MPGRTSDRLMTSLLPNETGLPPPPPAEDRPRRPWYRRRWLWWSAGVVVFLLLVTPLSLLWLMSSAIDRISAEELTALASHGEGPTTLLLVGSDSRDDLPDDLEGRFGTFSGRRADVVILAQIDGGGARLISLPRDLRVTIPGRGTNRVNAAYAFGGPDLLVETVTNETGIPIHHYIEVGFGGFARLVDSVGGIQLDFTYPARDLKSGLDVLAGSQTVDGATALAFARSRNYQELRDGEWRSVDTGDINRTRRQQQVLAKVVAKGTDVLRFWQVPGFLRAVGRSITADEGLSYGFLVRIAFSLLGTGSDDVAAVTLPVRGQTGDDGRAYVVPVEPAAGELLAAFRAGESLADNP